MARRQAEEWARASLLPPWQPRSVSLCCSRTKRKHIVPIGWNDGHNQAAVFEVGKNAIRPALETLEARSRKKVEYESEDAKKNIGR
jgi:hypothetical protein